MADLTKERCIEALLFAHCGEHMFGLFVLRERRSGFKQYCALFTCFSSSVVLIEVIYAMDTDSFIQALRKFMVRR